MKPTIPNNNPHKPTSSQLIAIAILIVSALVTAPFIVSGIDWVTNLRPATLAFLRLQNPYLVHGTFNPPWLFILLAPLAILPEAIGGGLLTLVQWISQTFIQLVMLSVIMVGQNIIGRAADKRAAMTFADTEAIFHEVGQIQAHLQLQDEAMDALIRRIGPPDGVCGR